MDKADVKKCKKTLNILKIAATDKENITSKIHKKKMNVNAVKTSVAKKNKKNALDNRILARNSPTSPHLVANINTRNKSIQSNTVLATDLIVDNPSENYWRNLAESCRSALDAALKENIDLHNKIVELEYENTGLKTMLNDAKSLVEVLTEMIEEGKDDFNESAREGSQAEEEEEEEEAMDGESSDSDFENMSFRSCVQ